MNIRLENGTSPMPMLCEDGAGETDAAGPANSAAAATTDSSCCSEEELFAITHEWKTFNSHWEGLALRVADRAGHEDELSCQCQR